MNSRSTYFHPLQRLLSCVGGKLGLYQKSTRPSINSDGWRRIKQLITFQNGHLARTIKSALGFDGASKIAAKTKILAIHLRWWWIRAFSKVNEHGILHQLGWLAVDQAANKLFCNDHLADTINSALRFDSASKILQQRLHCPQQSRKPSLWTVAKANTAKDRGASNDVR